MKHLEQNQKNHLLKAIEYEQKTGKKVIPDELGFLREVVKKDSA